MTNEKRLNHICTIKRALGIIEGFASNITNDAASRMLYTATEMIDDAVAELAKMDGDGNG